MNRFLAAALALICAAVPLTAQAQVATFDAANYAQQQANHMEQILQTSKLAQQVAHDLDMVRNQMTQIRMMNEHLRLAHQQLIEMPASLLARAKHDFAELDQIIAQEHELSQRSEEYDAIFKEVHPDYHPLQDNGARMSRLDHNTQTAAHDAQTMIHATLQQATTGGFQKTADENSALISRSGGSVVAATQVGSRLAVQQIEQLQKLQTLEAMRGQVEINYYMAATARANEQGDRNKIQDREERALYQWAMAACPQGLTCTVPGRALTPASTGSSDAPHLSHPPSMR